MGINEVRLSGILTSIEPLRFTPAGVPLVSFRLRHSSRQVEAGTPRSVECEIAAVALAQLARDVSGYRDGDAVRVSGFLNRRSRASTQLVLHAATVERHAADEVERRG